MSTKDSLIDFRHLFKSLPGLFIVLLPDLTVAAVSDEYLRATMTKREDLVGKNIFDSFPDNPEDDTSHSSLNVRASFEKVLQTGKSDTLPIQKYDVQRPAEEGGGYEERFWKLATFPAFDDDGKVAYIIHHVENITQQVKLEQNDLEQHRINVELQIRSEQDEAKRKIAEDALEDARLRLEAALDAGEIGTWTWDVINNRVIADKNLAKFFSVSEADAQGGKVEKYFASIHLEDRERIEKSVYDALENSDTYEAECRVIKPDNSFIWIVARGRILRDENGNPFQLPGVVIDITERKRFEEDLRKSQERLKLVLDASKLGLWYCDLPFDVLNWSDSTKNHFWLPPEAAVTIDDFYNIIHPDDREKTKFAIDKSVENRTEYDVEYRTVNPLNNRVKWIRAIGRGFYDKNNNPYSFDGITIDITEDKMIQSEREQLLWSEKNARAEAENANRLKDDFLATLSHELRTPLSSILGWSRLLKEGQITGDKAQRAVEIIERNAKSQAQLIEDILDVSRIISGKLRLDVQPLDLASIIELAIESLRPAAEAKNIRLQRVIDSRVTISGDADRLQQVIWNLLSNAIKFTPKDGYVRIKLERINSHVEITVADNGIGIDNAALPFIFERFRQSDSSTTRTHGGLGLGLAIVRHLVELHGGTVNAASEGINQGSVFTIMFPIIPLRSKEIPPIKEESAERIQPMVNNPVTFNCPPEIKGLRILLVDDEADTRDLLIFVFQNCQAQVTGVSSANAALEAVKANDFDVLVSDIGMPERDGYDLIKSIRQLPLNRGGRIPAVALTAYARVEDRLRSLSAGFQMHVPKPVEPAELLTVVASLAHWNNKK